MGGLFGGGGGETINTSSPIIGSLRLQTSTRGKPIPLVYGKTRVAANLVWYSDFTAIPHTTTTSSGGGGGKGGGGGGGGSTNTTYTYTAAVILALCEGAINSVPRIWADKDVYQGATTASQTHTVQDESYTLGGYSWDGQPHSCTVVNAAQLTGTPVVTINGSSDEWGWGGRSQLTEGYHYTRSGGTFTFIAGYGGQQVFITYDYSVPGYFVDACGQLGLSMVNGTYGQGYWGWLQTNHAAEALTYRGLAYVAGAAYDLGGNASMPNHSFEIDTQSAYSGAIRDANPKDVLLDWLTNPHYGVGFPLQKVTNWGAWSNYCVANNIFISPAYTEQDAASSMLQTLMQITNSGCVYSEGVLKIIPLGDVYASANGVSYSPNLTPVYDLTDDDYLDGNDPVKITRNTNADAYNQVQVKFYNRDNQYNEEIAEAKDQANIELFGLRTADPIDLKEICNAASARSVAQLILQRSLYIRNTYEFRLGWKFALLEPMDLVTLTDAAIGLNKTPVRIIEIEEDKYGELTVRAEEFPLNVCNSALYPTQNSGGYSANYNAAPGNVVTPALFEGPVDKVGGTGLGVWAAVTGASNDWGGCNVWVSMDGSTYKQLGKVTAGARYGTLTTALSANGTSVNVTLAGKGGKLIGSTAIDAQVFNTLCLVEDEFVSYTNTTLLGANQYTLNGMYRGGYHSYPVAHAAGKRFVRVDDAIVKSDPLDISLIGSTIYFKFTSFNIYGGGEQALADVTAYPYQILGTMLKLPPNDVPSGTFSLEGFGIRLKWGKVSDPDIDFYELRLGATWASGTLLERTKSTSYLWAVQVTATYKVWVAAMDTYGNYSTNPLLITCGINPPSVTSLASAFAGENVRLSWALVAGDFAIDHYEVRSGGSTWATSTPVASPMSSTFSEKALWLGTKRYFVAAVDVAGNVGAASSLDIVVNAPSQATPTVEIIDNNVLLRWQDVTQTLPVVKYEVYKGQVFATAARTAQGDTRFAALFENASGLYTYWIVATDSAGNTSTAGSVTAQVSQPPDYVVRDNYDVAFEGLRSNFDSTYTPVWVGSTPPDWIAGGTATASVTATGNDNVLMLTSTGADPMLVKNFSGYINFTGLEYPIVQLRVTRIAGSGWQGDCFYATPGHGYSASYVKTTADTSPAIGETKIITFDMSALTAGGADWMNNQITDVRLDLGNSAADVFAIDWVRILPNKASAIYLEDGKLYTLVKDETYQAHFTSNSYTTPQSQIDAGFPLYFEPGATAGWYEEQIDYGTTMGATSISVTLNYTTLSGSVAMVPKISVKAAVGDAWTDFNGVASAFANNFRYVKIRYDFSGAGGDDLIRIDGLNVKLSLKQKTDGGSGTANAGDAGGTTVLFNVPFIDVASIQVTAGGTTARIGLYDFVDIPNPTSFKALLYDTSGNRVSGPFSWTAKGA